MKKSDPEIHQEVLHELEWDTHVLETEIGVTVDRGIVTLSGQVGSWAKREAAQEAAHRVAGVLDVANDIEVHLPGSGPRSDADIARAVRDSLEWDVFVPDSRIRSTVCKGQVTLEGDVDFRQSKKRRRTSHPQSLGRHSRDQSDRGRSTQGSCSRAAERDRGGATATISARSSAREVGSGGWAGHGHGVVHSNSERQAVVGAVKGTPGVTHVDSRLRIEPPPG
jgi:osmotically-inducible protein OsmY